MSGWLRRGLQRLLTVVVVLAPRCLVPQNEDDVARRLTTMDSPSHSESSGLEPLRLERRAILVADIVDSTRLMQIDEAGLIARWRRLVRLIRTEVLPLHGGRLVKSLGDGLLVDFNDSRQAVQAALEIRRHCAALDATEPGELDFRLRMGVHAGNVAVDELDIYGTDVNIAARLADLAEPGGITISDEVCDQLTVGLDADVEDMGLCFAKHDQPLRAYRIFAADDRTPRERPGAQDPGPFLKPAVAVLPFEGQMADETMAALGQALANDVVAALARRNDLDVISSLSTRLLASNGIQPQDLGARLSCAFVLTGRCRGSAERVRLDVELMQTNSQRVLWADSYTTSLAAALDPDAPLAGQVATEVASVVAAVQLESARCLPLPNLASYTLLLGGIGLMHRAVPSDFQRARELLEKLAERSNRTGVAHAWLAKWHVLRAVQGWSADATGEGRHALEQVHRALAKAPEESLALAIGGLVHAYLHKDLATAGRMYADALAASPSEPLAWLFSATRHAYLGEGEQAEVAARHALRLSPFDPMRYFFDSLAATAMLSSGRWDEALMLGQRSLKRNRIHASTWRTIVYALVMLDRLDEARQAIQRLLEIEPTYTVSEFHQRFPGRDGPMAEPWAQALQVAGLPA